MPFLYLLFAFLIGVSATLLALVYVPKVIESLFSRKKNKIFKISFRIDYYQQPSIFNPGTKGVLIKSPPITVKIGAKDKDEALHILSDVVKEETRAELVSIRELKSDSDNIENLKQVPTENKPASE
jgi:hypothetical protein